MPISFESKGSFKNTERFLDRMKRLDIRAILEKYGQQGVAALAAATPVRTGLTASSWGYEITHGIGGWTIAWTNSDQENGGFPVAVMIQYGHGTGTGGWVQGIDYINPAIQPIFNQIANDVWKVVKSA
jgi:hypothetical protein